MNIKTWLGGGKSGDPSLYIDIIDRKRGILFDCGLNNFRHALLRKISDLFISHTHIDHFIGFDTLFRLNLSENRTIHVYGPPGITQNVIGKLQGYTWNICQNLRLIIRVNEIVADKVISTTLESWHGFRVEHVTEHSRPTDVLLDSGEFQVKYIQLDHKIPSFGYSFLEAESCNVQKDAMQAMELEPGPWVGRLKTLALQPDAGETTLHVGDREYAVHLLSQKLLIRKQGKKITYLTDFIFDEDYIKDVVRFSWQSDILFCEATFSEYEREKAKKTHHLTAKEAGRLARLAQVKQLVLFHFSKRYQDYSLLLDEARNEFSNVE